MIFKGLSFFLTNTSPFMASYRPLKSGRDDPKAAHGAVSCLNQGGALALVSIGGNFNPASTRQELLKISRRGA